MTNGSSLSGLLTSICHCSLVIGHLSFLIRPKIRFGCSWAAPFESVSRCRWYYSCMRKEESWGLGLAVAVLAVAVYLALRPPLFNYDGYVYRLQAFSPFQDENLNPHHLLWHPLQAGLLKISESIGRPTTAPFQIFGLAINCLTL